jgi:hypothetical protein
MTVLVRRSLAAALLFAGIAPHTFAQSSGTPASETPAPIVGGEVSKTLAPEPEKPAATDALDAALDHESWWTIRLEPMLWYAGPSGKIKMPVSTDSMPSSGPESEKVRINALDADDTKLRPAGTVTIASDLLRFQFNGADFDGGGGKTLDSSFRLGPINFAPGDDVDTSISFGTYELTASIRVYHTDFGRSTAKDTTWFDDIHLGVFALAGARLYDVDVEVRRNSPSPASIESSHVWIEPIIGARLELNFNEDFAAWVQASGGAMPLDEHSSSSFDIAVGFEYRPIRNVSIQLGFRQLAFGLSDGENLEEFEWSGRLAGLFTGVVIRF